MPPQHTLRNLYHWACAIWHLNHHVFCRMICNPGCKQRVTMSQESICTDPIQAGAHYLKIPAWGLHCSNCAIQIILSIFGIFWGTGDKPNRNQGLHIRWRVNIFCNITNCEIQWVRILITRITGQGSLLRCTNDRYNPHSGRSVIQCIALPLTSVHLPKNSTAVRLRKAHRLSIQVHLTWAICQ